MIRMLCLLLIATALWSVEPPIGPPPSAVIFPSGIPASGQIPVSNGTGLVGYSSLTSDTNGNVTSGFLAITPQAVASGTQTALTITGAANTDMTLSTEVIGANFNFSATKQWATGALTTQREAVFQAPTYSFVGASTITTAATLAITGAPAAGTNATISTSLALWVQTGNSALGGALTISPTAGNATFIVNAPTGSQPVVDFEINAAQYFQMTCTSSLWKFVDLANSSWVPFQYTAGSSSAGYVSFAGTTSSSSTSTGEVVIGGGLGVGGTIYCGSINVPSAGYNLITGTATGSVACVFTATDGPTGASTAIQGWETFKVAGVTHYRPYW